MAEQVSFTKFKSVIGNLPENQGATEQDLYDAWYENYEAPRLQQQQRLEESRSPVKDIGASLAGGAVNLVGGLYGLADAATGGNLDESLGRVPSETLESASDYWNESKSDYLKQQQADLADVEGFIPKAKELLSNPYLITNMTAESIPSFLPGIGAAGVAAKAKSAKSFREALERGEDAKDAARKAAKDGAKSGATAAIGADTAYVSGLSYAERRDRVLDMSDEELAAIPGFEEMIDAGMSMDEIRNEVANDAGLYSAAVVAPVTALSLKLSGAGKFLGDIGAGTLGQGSSRAMNTVKGGVRGAAVEAPQEAVQTGAERVGANLSERELINPEQLLTQDLPGDLAVGTIVGGAAGGSIGAGAGLAQSTDIDERIQSLRSKQVEAEEVNESADQVVSTVVNDVAERGGDELDQQLAETQTRTQVSDEVIRANRERRETEDSLEADLNAVREQAESARQELYDRTTAYQPTDLMTQAGRLTDDVSMFPEGDQQAVDNTQQTADMAGSEGDQQNNGTGQESLDQVLSQAQALAAPTGSRPVLQNRDRSTPASIAQMRNITSDPDYGRLGFSRNFGEGSPVVEPGVSVPDTNLGKQDYASTSDGERIPVQYAVVEADSLLPSNRTDGTQIDQYESGVEGVSRAIAGNGRVAGLQNAYASGNGDQYRQELIDDAEMTGIDSEAVTQMKAPVLVRIMPSDRISSDIGDRSNTSGTASLSPSEQARNDTRRVDAAQIPVNDDGQITRQAATAFVATMPASERGSLMDGTQPNRKAYERLENLLFNEAFESPALLRLQAEATNDEVRTVMAGLRVAAGRLARLKGAGRYDIRSLVSEAAEVAVNAKRANKKLSDYIEQTDLVQNPEIMPIVKMMADNIRSAKRIGENLSRLADVFYAESQAGGVDMFGESAPQRSPEQLLSENFNDGQTDTQDPGDQGRARLDDASNERADETGRTTEDTGREDGTTATQEGRQEVTSTPESTESQEPIPATVTLSSSRFGASVSVESVRKAREFARESFSGQAVKNINTGEIIKIPWQGIKKASSGKISPASLAAFEKLDQVISNGRLVKTESDNKSRSAIKSAEFYRTDVDLDGDLTSIDFVARVASDGRRYYDHFETSEKQKARESIQEFEPGDGELSGRDKPDQLNITQQQEPTQSNISQETQTTESEQESQDNSTDNATEAENDQENTPEPEETNTEDQAEQQNIEDFGEKLGGARKDQPNSFSNKELSDEDIAGMSLSKIWPKSEIDAIEDIDAAAMATVLRGEIPTKPRKSYAVKRWVSQVKTIKELMRMYNDDPQRIKDRAQQVTSLRDMLAKQRVLTAIDRDDWKRIGGVSVYENASTFKRNDDGSLGEQVPSPFVRVDIDGARKRFDGIFKGDELGNAVKAEISEKAPATNLNRYEIRGYRDKQEWSIYRKSDKEYRPLKTFTGSDALAKARSFIQESADQLEQTWDKIKERDNVRKSDLRRKLNKPRTGKDYRKGRDVTPEMFTETFSFKGVEFGNWVKQGKGGRDRQGLLNQAYDALMDLAEITGLPPKAMSLNGTLGLGFGSRGSGAAAAHFEADSLVINLTKTKGAGSLAHEWFHALDNYFARKRGPGEFSGDNTNYRRENFITYRPENYYQLDGEKYTVPERDFEDMLSGKSIQGGRKFVPSVRKRELWTLKEGVRPEVSEAFASLVDALDKSPMNKRSAVIDAGKEDGYWSRVIERAARSFENYVIAKMQKEGYDNDFLANVVEVSSFPRDQERYPYLMPDEVRPIEAAFDQLFDTIETRETETGTELYSFAGTESQTADMPSLDRAVDMLESGQSRESVRRETGWFRGEDGQWRYEISDDEASLAALSDTRKKIEVSLSGAINHPALFEAYPDLRGLNVVQRPKPGDGGFNGKYLEDSDTIEIDSTLSDDEKLSVLLHEVQHAIQAREDFARGGAPIERFTDSVKQGLRQQVDVATEKRFLWDAINESTLDDVGEAAAKYRSVLMYDSMRRLMDYANHDRPSSQLRNIRNEIQWLYDGDIRSLDEARTLQRDFMDLPKRGRMKARNQFLNDYAFRVAQLLRDQIPASHLREFKDDNRQVRSMIKALGRYYEQQRQRLRPQAALAEVERNAQYLDEQSRFKSPHEIYEALAGEIEARNTQARINMTPEERRQTSPEQTRDVPRDEAIVIMGGLELSVPMASAGNGSASTAAVTQETASNMLRQDSRLRRAMDAGKLRVVQSASELPGNAQLQSVDTESEAFQNWFGDSKVVDENGDPLVVYHGTDADFNVFDPSKSMDTFFWFADNRDVIEDGDSGASGTSNIIESYVSIQNPAGWDQYDSMATDQLIQEGYDGLILEDDGERTVIAFYPNQIKSATGNNGNFDPENPNILESNNAASAQGAYASGTAYVVADGNTEDTLKQTAWHELTHAALDTQGDTFIQPEQKEKLFNRLDAQVKLARNSRNDSALKRAINRTEQAGTSEANYLEEVAGYLVTDYVSDPQSLTGKIRQWVQDFIGAIQSAVLRYSGVQIGRVSGAELNAIASAYADYVTKPNRGRTEASANDASESGQAVPLFSQAPDASRLGPSNFGAPEDTLKSRIIRKMQDKFKPLKDLQQNIKDAGGNISEDNDVYRAEERFHGMAENDIRLMREQFVEPMADMMARYDIDQDSFDEYLIAKHAPERNAYIASINPEMPDGGSGMTDAQAQAVIDKVRDSGKQGEYEQTAQIVYDLLQSQRDLMRQSGLEDDGLLDAWEESYDFYVPLKGWKGETEGDGMPISGSGYNIGGRESRRAMGRSTESASPSSFAISDTTKAIIRKRKNEVGNALLELIKDNPNPDLWNVFTDDNPDTDRRIVRVRDQETGEMVDQVRETPIPMAMMRDRYFATKKDGKEHYIKIEDDRLMNAMKNVGPETNGALIRTLGGINRILSSLNTSYAPEFVVSNFSRDIQTAILNLQAEQSLDKGDGKASGEKISAKTVKKVPVAMKAILSSLRGKELEGEGKRWQTWFDEFRAEGAKTGFFDMKDLDGQSKELQTLITMSQGGAKGNALKFAKAAATLVEDLNTSVENAVRLSAYVAAREAGISKSQSASLAKNMTVNFNRRGEIGTLLNSLYMFANASIQGVANFARTMATLKGDKTIRWRNLNNAQKIAVGIVAGSYFLGMANRLAAGEDDDDENWYDKIPDYVKERNIVIMKSMFGGDQDGTYWKIPLPYGYNVFSVLGTGMESVFSGNKKATEASTEMLLATLGSFSPIGFQDSQTVQGLLLKNAAPTVVKPVVDLALNENFMGSTIYSENLPFGTPSPDSALARRSTPVIYREIASWMNEVTGGSEYRSGAIDVNPDVFSYVLDYFGGSAYQFFGTKSPDAVIRSVAGLDMEMHRTPFLSRISGKVLHYEDTETFYQRRNKINQIHDEQASLSGPERMKFTREYRDILRLRPRVRFAEKRLSALRKERNAVYDLDLSLKERDRRLKVIEEKMKAVVDEFNRAYGKSQ